MRDLRSAIKIGLYDTDIPYPKRPHKPILSRDHSSEDARVYAEALHRYEGGMVDYTKRILEYRKDDAKHRNQFKVDALEDCGLTNNPKADMIFSMAQERGSAMESVLSELEDLSELF